MLTDADHREVLAVLGHLADAAGTRDYGQRLLAAVCRIVRCDVAALNDVDPSVGRLAFFLEPATFPVPEGAPEVLAEHAHTHPLVQYVQRTGDGSAMRISDVVTTQEFHESVLYQRLYRPIGVEYQMAITLALPLPAVVAITVSRGDEEFTDHERELLDLMRPHVTAGWVQASEVARLTGLLEPSRPAAAAPGLTPRETEILALLVGGDTNQEIAGRLNVAAGTVKKHLDNIYAKLGVRGRVQAVTLALELGLGGR